MVIKEIKSGFWILSSIEKDLRLFMGDSYTDTGLRINCYVCVGDKDAAVFGAPNVANIDKWKAEIGRLCSEKELTYLSFCQPFDTPAISALREVFPSLRVAGSAMALHSLGEEGLCIRGKRNLTLGGRLWELSDGADGCCRAFCNELKILLSGRAYGSNCATEDKISWLRGAKNYRRDNPFPFNVPVGTELICPSFGPVVDNIAELMKSDIFISSPASRRPKISFRLYRNSEGGQKSECCKN